MTEQLTELPFPSLQRAVKYRLRFVGGQPTVDCVPPREYPNQQLPDIDQVQATEFRAAMRVFSRALRICNTFKERKYNCPEVLRGDVRAAIELARQDLEVT